MTGPSWLPDTFAAIMLVVAAVSAARLAAAVPGPRQAITDTSADCAHLLMAIAMSGMLVASLRTLPDEAWEVVFGVLTAWFAVRVGREARGRGARAWAGGCHAPHLVHSVAMLYMFLALKVPVATSGGSGMGGMSGSSSAMLHLPTLALVLALLLAGYAVRDLDRLTDPAGVRLYHPAQTGSRRTRFGAAALATAGASGAATGPAVGRSAAAAPGPAGGSPAGRPVPGRGLASARRLVIAPRLAICCRIAMGITMAYMLVIMI
jgi:hypothetical protein